MQNKLSEYKSRLVKSFPEVTKLSAHLEQLHQERSEILAKEQEASKYLKQMIALVGIPPGQTSNTSVLQSDRVFRQNLKHYAETRDQLENLVSKFSSNHPEVIAEKGKLQAVQSALLTRSRWLLGRPVAIEILQQLSINISSSTASWKSRESLLQELKQVKIDRQRLKNRSEELNQQIAQIESQIRTTGQQELENKQVVSAEALASTFVKLDLSKSTTSIKPSLLEKSSPNLKLILLAALSQSQHWFTKTTQMATLVLLLGLAGGSWVTNELFASQIAQAETARIDLSVQSQPNESYETLVSRAEAAMQAVVEDNWKQNTQVTSVTVMVMAENYGAIAPVLAMEVSRSQWNGSPNVQRWGTHFTSARSLLGFGNIATTTASEIITDTAVATEPEDSFVGRLETDEAATTYNQNQTSETEQGSLIADATVPFEDVATTSAGANDVVAEELEDTSVSIDNNTTPPKHSVPTVPTSLEGDVKAPVAASVNSPKEFRVTNKVISPQIVQRETTHIDLSVQSQPNESYETLLSRAEVATQAVVQENFKKNGQATAVTVMVMAENYGAIAPVMSLEVSRSQWSKSPNIQRWGTYLTSARSLLGLKNVATTTDMATPAEPETAIFKIEQLDNGSSVPETATPVTSSQSPNSTSTRSKVAPASNSTPKQPSTAPRNSQTRTSTNRSSGSTLLSTPTSAPQNSLVTPPSGTRINNSTQISVPNITTPTMPNANFPETPLLDTSRGTDISAPNPMSN